MPADQVRKILPPDTAATWDAIAQVVPPDAYRIPQQAVNHILLGLGYFDDVDPDDALPVPRNQIVNYWTRRQPEIVAALGR